MAESDRPRSPFAAMADLSAQKPVRVPSAGEIEQKLAWHQLYLKTEYHEGHRADFSSADLTGFDFAGLGHLAVGTVDLSLLASLLIGSLPGIALGSVIASRAPERALRLLLAAVLTLVGIRLVAA